MHVWLVCKFYFCSIVSFSDSWLCVDISGAEKSIFNASFSHRNAPITHRRVARCRVLLVAIGSTSIVMSAFELGGAGVAGTIRTHSELWSNLDLICQTKGRQIRVRLCAKIRTINVWEIIIYSVPNYVEFRTIKKKINVYDLR